MSGEGTVRQILACLQTAVQRGSWDQRESADLYTWRWGDVAAVVADAMGRIVLALPGHGSEANWRNCAMAAA